LVPETVSYSLFLTGLTASIDEIDKLISDAQDVLTLLPRSSRQRASLLSDLGEMWMCRFNLSDDERDIETSILQSTHAIFLPFHFSTRRSQDPISVLFCLAEALFHRSCKFGLPNDIRYCIKYLHHLRDFSPEAFDIIFPTRDDVTILLVRAIAHQQETEPGNVMQGIEEISVLCCEFLSSDLPEPQLVEAVATCVVALSTHIDHSRFQPPQQVIECLREVDTRLPNSHATSIFLGQTYTVRFSVTQSNEDYERAMAPLDKIIASHSPADTPTQYSRIAFRVAAELAHTRFLLYKDPKYLEEAIFRCRAHLSSTSLEDPERGAIIQSLVELEGKRLDGFGVTNRLPGIPPSDPVVVDPPSFPHLTASLAQSNAVQSGSMTLETRLRHYEAVLSMDRITDNADIEEGVKYCRLLLASLQQCTGGGGVTLSTHITIFKLGEFLHHAFTLTNNTEYLNESIDVHQAILKIPSAQCMHFEVVQQLVISLCSRFILSKDMKGFDEMMRLFPIAATSLYASVPDRFQISSRWAQFARIRSHPSTFNAYMTAISLIEDTLTFAPTLETQHSRLVTMRHDIETLPLDYASYQVHAGKLKEAIETLEQGRGLLWSEMRGLRTSIDRLRAADSFLAEKFAEVNRELAEALTMSGSPSSWTNDCKVDGGEGIDPIGRVVLKQRNLLDERTGLLTRIRSLLGFENFLTTPSFDTLRSVAANGPVIVINHSKWRSDIIILLHNSPPSLITTPDSFYEFATGLENLLLSARKEGLESAEYEEALSFVLESLYARVGRPVIQRLQELNVPEQSRVWWCPTSVFCSLPLHAMGPIRSEGPVKLYFSDLYIPSYTPTLSALIEARKPGSHSFEKPSILLVAQPDESMPRAWKEMALVRDLNTKVTALVSKRATPSAVKKRLKGHRFAHFSCHGILETGKPFDASFKLYDGERLTLLDIIRSRLPSAEFAFLSACHTAELTEESLSDEGLHLSAAVQYCGFRSVVGTMWAMADIDGKFLAENFYESLFSDRWQGVPYYERTAEALRDSVKELRRKKRVATERWVNFVHYGA
jgi:CHAT domain-containing protein